MSDAGPRGLRACTCERPGGGGRDPDGGPGGRGADGGAGAHPARAAVRQPGATEAQARAVTADRGRGIRDYAIQRPLLIGQGANDPRVKQAESDQIVAAMQAKKIPVTYALFPDEGHGFARPENERAFNAVVEGFLGACLGGRVEPIGDDLAGSSITVPTGAEGVAGLAEALRAHTQEVRR